MSEPRDYRYLQAFLEANATVVDRYRHQMTADSLHVASPVIGRPSYSLEMGAPGGAVGSPVIGKPTMTAA